MLRTELNEASLQTYTPSQVIIKAGRNNNERILDLKRNKFFLDKCPQIVIDRVGHLLELGCQVAINCRSDDGLVKRFEDGGDLFAALQQNCRRSISAKQEKRNEGTLFRKTNQYVVISTSKT